MIVLREVSKRRVQAVVERILDESVRNSMIKASEKLHRLMVQTKWQNGLLMRFDMFSHSETRLSVKSSLFLNQSYLS